MILLVCENCDKKVRLSTAWLEAIMLFNQFPAGWGAYELRSYEESRKLSWKSSKFHLCGSNCVDEYRKKSKEREKASEGN